MGWLKTHKTVVADFFVNQHVMNSRGRIVLFLREWFANTRRSRGPARFVKKRRARDRAPFGRHASKLGLAPFADARRARGLAPFGRRASKLGPGVVLTAAGTGHLQLAAGEDASFSGLFCIFET